MSNFPTSLPTSATIPVEASGTALYVNHVASHQGAQNEIIAIATKVGVDGSAVTTTHDYKLSGVTGTDKAVSKTGTETLTNKTLTAPTVTGATITTSTVNGVTLQTAGTATDFLAANGTYVAGSVSNASTTAKGIVELATSAEITAGTATGGTGAALVVTPDSLAASTPVFNGSGLTNVIKKATASDTTVLSANTERSTNSLTSLTIVKSIRCTYGGTVRVKHQMKMSGSAFAVESQIYVNGLAYGTLRSNTSTTYVAYSEDITINASDIVQLLYRTTSSGVTTVYVNNFTLNFDLSSAGEGTAITD